MDGLLFLDPSSSVSESLNDSPAASSTSESWSEDNPDDLRLYLTKEFSIDSYLLELESS